MDSFAAAVLGLLFVGRHGPRVRASNVGSLEKVAAVDVFLARRDTPKGVVIQGAYWAHGQVPEAFGGAPEPPEAA